MTEVTQDDDVDGQYTMSQRRPPRQPQRVLYPTHTLDPAVLANVQVHLIAASVDEPLHRELEIPWGEPIVRLTLKAPLGWQGYLWELLGTFDVPTRGPGWAILASSDLFRERYGRDWVYVWRRRVYCDEAHGYLEVRWHPHTGPSPIEVVRTSNHIPLDRDQDFTKALHRGARLLRRVTPRGRRPRDLRKVYNKFVEDYRKACTRLVDQLGYPDPTIAAIVAEMSLRERTYYENVRTFRDHGLSWPPAPH